MDANLWPKFCINGGLNGGQIISLEVNLFCDELNPNFVRKRGANHRSRTYLPL